MLQKNINNSQIAYEYIRDAIFNGDMKPGTSMTEKWLAEHLQMSRTPVREAMIRLQIEGLITVIHNRAIVTNISPVDIQEVFQLRLLLEPPAAAICAAGCNRKLFAEIRQVTEGLLRGKNYKYSAEIHDLHRVVIESTKNRRWIAFSEHLRNQVIRILNASGNIAGRITLSLKEHLLIIDAIVAGNAKMAEKYMRSHIESNMRSMLDATHFHIIFKE